MTVFSDNTKPLNDAVSKEHHACCIVRQITISAYMEAAVFFNWCSAGLMKTETHRTVVQHPGSMTAQGLMVILLVKPFYVNVAHFIPRSINLAKFMIVDYASTTPTCILHARGKTPPKLRDERPILTQCDRFKSDPTINTVPNNPPELCGKRMDRQNAVKQAEELSNMDWLEYPNLSNQYSA